MQSFKKDLSIEPKWSFATTVYDTTAYYFYSLVNYFFTTPEVKPQFPGIPELKSEPVWGELSEFRKKDAATAVGRLITDKAAPIALSHPEGACAWYFGPNKGGIFSKKSILITEPKHIEYFIKERHDDIEDHDGTSLFAEIDDIGLQGRGNIFSLGANTREWREERAAFSQLLLDRSTLKKDAEKIQLISDFYIKQIRDAKDNTVDLIRLSIHFTLQTISLTKLGLSTVSTESMDELSASITQVAPILSNPLSRTFPFSLFYPRGKEIIKTGQQAVHDKMLVSNKESILGTSNLLTFGKNPDERKKIDLNSAKIKKNAGFALVVGHETTANLLLYTILLLSDSNHHAILEKLREALSSIEKPVHEWTIEDIDKVPYLTAIIFETLRLYPPVPLQVTIVKNPIPFAGGVLNKGDAIFTSQLITQRLKSVWGADALEFKPERFLSATGKLLVDKEERLQTHHPYAFFVFGFEGRKCPGRKLSIKEAQVFVARLVDQFDFRFKNELHHPFPIEVILTLKSKLEKIELQFVDRKPVLDERRSLTL